MPVLPIVRNISDPVVLETALKALGSELVKEMSTSPAVAATSVPLSARSAKELLRLSRSVEVCAFVARNLEDRVELRKMLEKTRSVTVLGEALKNATIDKEIFLLIVKRLHETKNLDYRRKTALTRCARSCVEISCENWAWVLSVTDSGSAARGIFRDFFVSNPSQELLEMILASEEGNYSDALLLSALSVSISDEWLKKVLTVSLTYSPTKEERFVGAFRPALTHPRLFELASDAATELFLRCLSSPYETATLSALLSHPACPKSFLEKARDESENPSLFPPLFAAGIVDQQWVASSRFYEGSPSTALFLQSTLGTNEALWSLLPLLPPSVRSLEEALDVLKHLNS